MGIGNLASTIQDRIFWGLHRDKVAISIHNQGGLQRSMFFQHLTGLRL